MRPVIEGSSPSLQLFSSPRRLLRSWASIPAQIGNLLDDLVTEILFLQVHLAQIFIAYFSKPFTGRLRKAGTVVTYRHMAFDVDDQTQLVFIGYIPSEVYFLNINQAPVATLDE